MSMGTWVRITSPWPLAFRPRLTPPGLFHFGLGRLLLAGEAGLTRPCGLPLPRAQFNTACEGQLVHSLDLGHCFPSAKKALKQSRKEGPPSAVAGKT